MVNNYEIHQEEREKMKKKVILFGIIGILVVLAISPVLAQETEEREFKNSAGLLLSVSSATPLLGTPTIVYERTLSTNWGIEGRFYVGYVTTLQGYIKGYLKPNFWISGGIGTVSGWFKGTILSFGIGYKNSLESFLSKFGISSNSKLFSRTNIQWGIEIQWLSGELESSQVRLPSLGAFGALLYRF